MSREQSEPIFVVGTGRSGSTVFFDIFAKHPNVAWLSTLAGDYPNHHRLNKMIMRCCDNAIFDRLLGRRFGPSEAYPFWELQCPGFTNPYRDLRGDDVMPIAATRLRESIAKIVTHKRSRFIAKITGWPRVRYLREIFPQALFIEVTREPRATVCSLLEVHFWDGWRGPPNWRRGPLPPDLDILWRQEGESFVALAAIEFVMIQRAMAQCRATLPTEQIHTVSYSRLCAEPVRVFEEVVQFCRLNWSARFENIIRGIPLSNRDDKWRRCLSIAQQAVLDRTLDRAKALQMNG